MKRRCLFNGSRNRNVWLSRAAKSDPKVIFDMHKTSNRDDSSAYSILDGILSTGRSSHSSNQTRIPSARRRSARARTVDLSLELWLRNTSIGKYIFSLIAGDAYPRVRPQALSR